MDLTQVSMLLANTLLISASIIVMLSTILIVNNMIHRWWKPMSWSFIPQVFKDMVSSRFIDDAIKQEPALEPGRNTRK